MRSAEAGIPRLRPRDRAGVPEDAGRLARGNMSSILLGRDAANRPVHLTDAQRRSTHMHVIGGSGTGKSKFLEWMIRRDIREGRGLCLIDWHGTLYNDL